MRTFKHLIVAAIVAACAGVSLVAQEYSVIQGQLLRLDHGAKRIVIKTHRGAQMQFEYTDATVVHGADAVSGLGTHTGTPVRVQYEKQETRLLAIQIDVERQ